MKTPLTPRQELIKYSRCTVGFIRVARESRSPSKLIEIVNDRLDKVRSVAATQDAQFKALATRINAVIEAMLRYA